MARTCQLAARRCRPSARDATPCAATPPAEGQTVTIDEADLYYAVRGDDAGQAPVHMPTIGASVKHGDHVECEHAIPHPDFEQVHDEKKSKPTNHHKNEDQATK